MLQHKTITHLFTTTLKNFHNSDIQKSRQLDLNGLSNNNISRTFKFRRFPTIAFLRSLYVVARTATPQTRYRRHVRLKNKCSLHPSIQDKIENKRNNHTNDAWKTSKKCKQCNVAATNERDRTKRPRGWRPVLPLPALEHPASETRSTD